MTVEELRGYLIERRRERLAWIRKAVLFIPKNDPVFRKLYRLKWPKRAIRLDPRDLRREARRFQVSEVFAMSLIGSRDSEYYSACGFDDACIERADQCREEYKAHLELADMLEAK